MKFHHLITLSLALSLMPLQAKDAQGSKDPQGFKRITDSEILWSSSIPYDAQLIALEKIQFDYNSQKFKDTKKQEVEGAHDIVYYKMPGSGSTLEAVRQYQSELKEAGFETLFEAANQQLDDGYNRFVEQIFPEAQKTKDIGYLHQFNHEEQRYAVMRGKTEDGNEQYVTLYATKLTDSDGTGYAELKEAHDLDKGNVVLRLDVLTPKAMTKRMEVVKAEEITKNIADTGRVVIYGVFFDTDKADITPESEPSLVEMAKAIDKSSASQKFLIVGHTDNQGSYEHNVALSSRRAAAVVDALIKHHSVNAKKILPIGVGMASPVSTNSTEEGRAKNRRVEIVAM